MKTNPIKHPNNKAWYTLKNQSGQPAELLIYDVIGDWAGLSARQLVDTLKSIDADTITVRVNSPGGSVFDGIAIYNALRHHKAKIHVQIEGLAASIASVIAMAGDTVSMAENALLMIHNPFGWVGGDAEELRKMADMLDKTTEVIAKTYANRSTSELDAIKTMMNDETWFTAAEALQEGLIDTVDKPVQMVAHFDLSGFMKAPQSPISEPTEDTGAHALAVMGLCNQAGYPEMAERFVRQQLGIDAVNNKLGEFERIKSLCAAAQCSDRASEFIQAGQSEDQVRTQLFDMITRNDTDVQKQLTPSHQGQAVSPLIDTQAVYRKRNQTTAA